MKRKTVTILAVAAFLSVAAAGIGTASAYFTSYVEAAGRKEIRLGDTTTLTEQVDGSTKTIVITNDATSPKPVWVRAKAFAAGSEEKPNKILTYQGTGWINADPDGKEDGYWYYYGTDKMPLMPDKSTEELRITIDFSEFAKAENLSEEEQKKGLNIIVVYETTPAVEDGEDEDGNIRYADPSASDWTRGITKTV